MGRSRWASVGLAGVLTVLLALGTATVTPAGTAAANTIDTTGTTDATGAPSLLDGTWYAWDEPYIRIVFTGGQGVLEIDYDGPSSWEPVHRPECMGGKQPYHGITGAGQSFTGKALWNYACSFESTFTEARFEISAADSENLTLAITYGYVVDEWSPAYTYYYTRPGTLPPPAPEPDPVPEPDPTDLQCGQGESAVTLTSGDVAALAAAAASSVLLEEPEKAAIGQDPCVLFPVPGQPDPVGFTAGRGEVLVADGGGELPFLMTGDDSAVWEVVEDKQLLSLNQPVRCWTLRTSIPIDTGGTFWNRARNLGKITVQHTDLCVVRDLDGAYKLTNGTPTTEYDPQGQLRVTGWEPPARPGVTIDNADGFLVFNPGGMAGSGISHFELTGNQSRMSVQIQIAGGVNIGVPMTQGLFVGLNRTFTKDYDITAEDLGAPR